MKVERRVLHFVLIEQIAGRFDEEKKIRGALIVRYSKEKRKDFLRSTKGGVDFHSSERQEPGKRV